MNESLTSRQYQVLVLVARSLSNKEIAQQFHITVSTVEYHLTNICRKLGAKSRTEAVVIALKRGLINPNDIGRLS